jgi:formylglycine-generating enzyme required for sulfatase activity/predicted Ser/Thr protein kinase
MTLGLGTIIYNRYRIAKLLGQGGFGALYRAWDMTLERPCALKENLDASPEAQRQFLREAKILANLTHPNLPRVTDYFSIQGQGEYLVMDFIDGQDLQEMLDARGGPLPEDKVLPWVEQVCDALAYLHSQNPPIIHRDIKPANIKVTTTGRAMLVDFGIAKVYDPMLKTTSGAQAVTPGYSPQEQYGKGSTDARSDIYGLGATLYALLTGLEPPESIERNLGTPLVAPRTLNRAISISTERAILKAMQMLPDMRYQTAGQLKVALSAGSPVQKTPAPPPAMQSAKPQAPAAGPGIWFGVTGAVALILVVALGILLRGAGDPAVNSRPPTHTVLQAAHTAAPSHTLPATPSPAVETIVSQTPSRPVATQVWRTDGMVMLYVSGGAFAMGSDDADLEAGDDERPQHTVFLSGYWIDQTEVTNRMYALCVQAGICRPPEKSGSKTRLIYYGDSRFDDYPVIYVAWEDADAYCRWAGRRLPSEAEWEKAARGIDGRIYPWGDTPPNPGLLNYNNQIGDTVPVGSYPNGVSPYGALDMAGNVGEWTADWYSEDYYGVSPAYNPLGPSLGTYRVLRGGSWFSSSRAVRVAFRLWNYPDLRFDSSGFRCAHVE